MDVPELRAQLAGLLSAQTADQIGDLLLPRPILHFCLVVAAIRLHQHHLVLLVDQLSHCLPVLGPI